MKREGDVVIADAPGGRRIKVKLEGHTLRVKEYANGAERAYYEIRLSGDEYERVKNILKNATSDVEILELFRGVTIATPPGRENADVIDCVEVHLLDTINGVVKAKKIISLNGKHVIYQDLYGNVKEAFLK